MTENELIDALAGSLELIASQAARALTPQQFGGCGYSAILLREALERVRDQAREAAALATEPRDDVCEEIVRALQSVALDYQTGRGTGTLPAVSETTWERTKLALRRLGTPVED